MRGIARSPRSPSDPTARVRPGRWLLALCAVLPCACQTQAPPRRMLDRVDDSQVTEWQLRSLTSDYVRRFAATVERAADQIEEQSNDPRVRRAALSWKATAVEAVGAIAFQDDPLAAFIELWASTEQMMDFLESDGGRELFGEGQSIAVAATRELVVDVNALSVAFVGDAGRAGLRELVDEWAVENPVSDLSFTRQIPPAVVARFERQRPKGTFAAVQNLEDYVEILEQLLPLYLELMPRQLRWQTQLLVDEYVSRAEVLQAQDDLGRMVVALDQVEDELDRLPVVIADEIVGLRQSVSDELDGLHTLIARERAAVLESIDAQRLETLDVLREESERVLRDVDTQRVATLEQARALVEEVGEGTGRELIDHLAWRVAQLGAGFGALLVIGLLIVGRKRHG